MAVKNNLLFATNSLRRGNVRDLAILHKGLIPVPFAFNQLWDKGL